MTVEQHRHDQRYPTRSELIYGQMDAQLGAVRNIAAPQRETTIRADYGLVVTDGYTIEPGATLVVDGILTIVG